MRAFLSRSRRGARPAGLLLLLLACCAAATTQAARSAKNSAADLLVKLDSGVIRGRRAAWNAETGNQVWSGREFLGVPFAAPPTGPRRWAAPGRAPRWSGVRNTTRHSLACPQFPIAYWNLDWSEDCLYLNVWAPPRERCDRRGCRVFVWFHGGALLLGAGHETLFNGSRLAFRPQFPTVVVTVNYRLGVFGFLSHPSLAAGAPPSSSSSSSGSSGSGWTKTPAASGNFGFLDQQAALEWVQRNIAAFGGSPSRVTIAGESAGGRSVSLHLATPSSHDLFHAAMFASGAFSTFSDASEVAQKAEDTLIREQGCSRHGDDHAAVRECLVALPAATVNQLQYNLAFSSPVLDGVTVPIQPQRAFASGAFRKVPMLYGSTKDEFHLLGMIVPFVRAMNAFWMRTLTSLMFWGRDTSEMLALYPLADFASPYAAFVRILGDRSVCDWREPVLLAGRHLQQTCDAGGRGACLRLWEIDEPLSFSPDPLDGAYHSVDNQFTFGMPCAYPDCRLLAARGFKWSPDELTHVDVWQQTIFDNAQGSLPAMPSWRPWRPTDRVGYLINGPRFGSAPFDHKRNHCDFWNVFGNQTEGVPSRGALNPEGAQGIEGVYDVETIALRVAAMVEQLRVQHES